MSKSVLVIDTPERCIDCEIGQNYSNIIETCVYCEIADCLDYDVILMTEEHYDCESKSRPDWCPLKLLPEKDTKNHFPDEFEDGYAIGWNACIDEITGDD